MSFAFPSIHCPSLMTGGVDKQYIGFIKTFRTSSEFQSSIGIIPLNSQFPPEATVALSRRAIPNLMASKAAPCPRDAFHATEPVGAASFPLILSAFAPQLRDSRCRG